MPTKKYYYAVGRRKQTTAVIKLYPSGTGKYTLHLANKTISLKEFFGGDDTSYKKTLAPLKILGKDMIEKYDADIRIHGGGKTGIVDSIVLGFARALIVENEARKTELKPYGLLKRDPRVKERKKFGLKKARKSPKWSKR